MMDLDEVLIELWKPGVPRYIVVIALFALALIVYGILLVSLRTIFRKDGIWKLLIKAISYPLLALLLEFVAFISINFLDVQKKYAEPLFYALSILLIIVIGWLAVNITRTIYLYLSTKYEAAEGDDEHQRGMVTQIHFLYRLIMFLIIVVTFGAILMSFPRVKSIGIGILSSAGIMGIAIGIAARPILLNLMAGFQIAITKMLKIGDAVFIENDFARIESIHLTHVIARTWDLRRHFLPISYFIDRPFQNWDAKNPELIGSVFIYCDYTVPVEEIRKKLEKIIKTHPNWNKKVCRLHMTSIKEKTIELRAIMTANDASSSFELCCFVREKLVEFLQTHYPDSLPCVRLKQK